MDRLFYLKILVLVALVAISCSGAPSPAHPPADAELQTSGNDIFSRETGSAPLLWGLWDIHFNESTKEFDALPLRGAQFTCNVTRFIDGPPKNLIISIENIVINQWHREFTIDVGIQHPFPGLDRFTGFDVFGVFLGETETDLYPGNPDLTVPGWPGGRLMNPDGYTRWFNYYEFFEAGEIMPLFGYYPGAFGSDPLDPEWSHLNGYKYFCDDITPGETASEFLAENSGTRGAFNPGSVNHREYVIRYAISSPITFQYAVIANWEPNIYDPDPPFDINDFPISANANEAVACFVYDQSDAWYINESSYGGDINLDISVFDWSASVISGVMDEYEIFCYSDAWTGDGNVDMTVMNSGDIWRKFSASIPVETLENSGPIEVWVEVSYPELDYSNNFGIENSAGGPLSSFFRYDIPIDGTPPNWVLVITPNGGEIMGAGSDFEVTWSTSWFDGSVDIQYSTDDFVSQIFPISDDVFNTGSYIWENIPNTPSVTAKVRVSDHLDPSVYDDSDDYFSILGSEHEGWARSWGGGNERNFGIAVDSDGNSYSTGYFRGFGEVDFNPSDDSEDLHESNGFRDIFLTKFDKDGNHLWAVTFGGSSDDEGHAVEIDPDGNVYVTGYFKGTVDFDPGPEEDPQSASGSEECFLSKFDPDGNYLWTDTWGSSENTYYGYYPFYGDCGEHVAADSNYVYVAGKAGQMFCRRYDHNGAFDLEVLWGGTSTWDRAYGIDVSDTGEMYISGRFTSTCDFDPGPSEENLTATDKADSFLLKFTSTGDYEWAVNWGGNDKFTGYSNPPNYVDCAYAVDTDANLNTYVTGIFYGTTDFDPGPGEEIHTAVDSGGYGDGYVVKFDPHSNFQWVRTFQGEHFQYGYGIETHPSGHVYATGRFYNDVDFDPGSGTDMHSSAGDCDMFITRYDTDGNWYWTRSWGSTSYDIGTCVDVDSVGNVWLSGYFRGTIDFDPGPGVDEHTNYSQEDCVVIKLLENGYWY